MRVAPRYATAVDKLEMLGTDADETDLDVVGALGICYFHLGRVDEARVQLRKRTCVPHAEVGACERV